MLTIHKNRVVSDVTLQQAAVRQKELDFYTNNFWIFGGTTVILAGNALRGPDGMTSFHETLSLLKEEQMSIYYTFVVSIVAYFGSSCCLLWVYPSGLITNIIGTSVLLLSLVVLLRFLLSLEHQVGMFGNSHDDDGRIKNLRPFERVGDLDQRAANE
eukprot:symbB.v1.2.033043.t1/scaffold4051.1/size47670/4